MHLKKILGKLLSDYFEHREEIAFNMPFDTEQEQQAASKYINYNIPYEDCNKLELIAHYKADCLEDINERLFQIYFHFYVSLIDYKISRILENLLGLV